MDRLPFRRARLVPRFLGLLLFATASAPLAAQTIDLYVDSKTGQVFTQPGPGRDKLGTFQRVDRPAEGAVAAPVPPSPAPVEAEAKPPQAEPTPKVAAVKPPPHEEGDKDIVAAVGRVLAGKWYERLSIRGYTQFRYNALFHNEGAGEWFVPTDRSVSDNNTFIIRRGRLILSGDATDRLYVYVQPELNAAPSSGDFSVQLRDLYSDIALDKEKEFRVRVGQSKVPFGWVNLQSSQNRIPLERPDAINSAAENERDIGGFFYWAPQEIRQRFRDLVRSGLKGSGDYGVVGLGIYSGQGPNKLDFNNSVHGVARLSYPFELPNGQFVEPGIQGYLGRFVVNTSAITVNGASVTPATLNDGLPDRRVGFSAIVYPQPVGFETEWNFGEGPELNHAQTAISSKSLYGGYVQATYKLDVDYGVFFPVARWQYYKGGRKFATNAPRDRVNEWDFGVEWQPIPEIELAAIYAYTPFRTNTKNAPYDEFTDASRLGLQLQWNY